MFTIFVTATGAAANSSIGNGATFAAAVTLPFAAGAMIYVVVVELIPRSREIDRKRDTATLGTMAGFYGHDDS